MNKQTRTKVKKVLPMKKCKYCCTVENLTIDHKNPLIKGGTDNLKNLQCLCKRCNGFKGQMTQGQVRGLFKWFLQVQESRIIHGKNPFMFKIPKGK